MPVEERHADSARKITWIGLIINLLLAAIKFLAGFFGHSMAMVADAVHSLSDLGSDLVVLFGLRIAARPRDESHQYGHGKVETSAAVTVGLMLIGVGGYIFWMGARGLYLNIETTPGWLALAAAGVSIVLKEALYQVTMRVGRKAKKPLIMANAWHHRSDALSSIAAFLGIGGQYFFGVNHLDQVAAMVVSLFVARAGAVIAWEAYQDLIDTSVGAKFHSRIVEVVSSINGVNSYHKLRTRKVGQSVFVDLHIEVDENLTVSQAHQIADQLEVSLKNKLSVYDVTVHVDVAEDEEN